MKAPRKMLFGVGADLGAITSACRRTGAAGSAVITVTARDPGGLTATQTVWVRVQRSTGSFDIDLVFRTQLTATRERAFRDAAQRWMAILAQTELTDVQTGGTISCGFDVYESPGTIDDLAIIVRLQVLDGPGGILAGARVCTVRQNGLPVFGSMVFDEADIDRLEPLGLLRSLIVHEIGHVLGIGPLWSQRNLLRNPSSPIAASDTHFVGPLAIKAFDAAGGDRYTGGKVPVENTGGWGTVNSHWRASIGNELMIWRLPRSSPPLLSAITIQSLADLGYTVDTSLADPYRFSVGVAMETPIELGHDIITGPIAVVDRNGRVVRVIPPPPRPNE